MRYAIVSDIHANRPAWEAVLDDIAREGVDAICCLGDIVGYGPRPRAVLESVFEHCENVVLGNHDAVIAGKISLNAFNLAARSAIEWTRDRLGEGWRAPFASLPLTLRGDGMLLTHGDAGEPNKFHYVTRAEHARASFRATKREVVFFGHTHQPGVFTCGKSAKIINKLPPCDLVLDPGKRYMINPGSVGDPRCRTDLRASYCIYDSTSRQLRFRRVEFDVDTYRREFQASGLIHKPFFLRVMDAESIREGDAGPVVADHTESATVDAGEETRRFARLQVAGKPVHGYWDKSQMIAVQREANRERKRSRAGVLLSLLLIAAGGVGLGFLLPLGEKAVVSGSPVPKLPEPEGVGEVTLVSGTAGVETAQPASDLERIMAEGWEDPAADESDPAAR